jgi:hypothetical protein
MIPFHIPTPQGCDIQTFYGFGHSTSNPNSQDDKYKLSWVKPTGVSHVYMMLIGGGAAGNVGNGGGSGAVTVWYGAAQHVPNKLDIFVRGIIDVSAVTQISYTTTSGTPYILLTAGAGTGNNGGAAMSANQFTASGFFQSVVGQTGSAAGGITPSATTFLSGGTAATTGDATANYGYGITSTSGIGFFQMQPIIVGVGSAGTRNTAIGCGSGINGVFGGSGMVLIASW